MRNKIRYIRLIGLIFVLIVGSSLTFAQNKSKRKSAKKPLVEVVSIVTDEKGSPLKNVSIICGEGAVVLYTDAKGRFQTKVENDATVMVEALGYEDKVYKLTGSNIVPEKIVLKKEPLFLTEESLVNRADGGKTYKGNEVGATSVLENGQFGTFPDLTLTNMLQGKMLGLQVRSTVSGLGNNTPDLFIRGQHGMSENTAIVIIDGVERPAADLLPEEIERIELLKDATAKILYGARAANEYGVTAGFGLPLPRSRSVLSISAQYVRMQGTESRFLNENTLRLCIGVTFNEQWFWKRKVQ